jgi:hypothetical protein
MPYGMKRDMDFSASQWAKLVILDFLIRAALFVAFSFNILLIPISIFISIIHLTIFATLESVISLFEMKKRFIPYAIATASNIIFIAAFIYIWILFIKSGHQTNCVSYPNDCDWVDGILRWRGIMTIIGITAVQIVANVIPIALVWSRSSPSVGSIPKS